MRYYNPNNTPIEWNADIGFRGLPRGNILWGLYGGYDRFRSSTSRYFSQVNAGFEFWFNKVFLGANAYVPVGTKEYDNIDLLGQAFIVSTSIPYQYNIAYNDQHDERVLPGADAELGWDITHGLTVYGGGYYFHHSGFTTVAGPKLRATYTFYRTNRHRLLGLFDRIRFEGLVTHDQPRGTSWFAGIRFTIGLAKQPNPTFAVIRHMVDPLRRDINGVSEAFNTEDLLRDSSGNLIKVDVADGAAISVRDAIGDDSAEIVGVSGTQTLTSTDTLEVGGHKLTISGGSYNFTVGNHSYTVQVGNNGEIQQASGATTSLITMDGANHVILKNLTLTITGNSSAIENADSFSLGMDTVTSDGPIVIQISAGQTGTLALDYNIFSSFIGLGADGSGALLDITSFTNNTLDFAATGSTPALEQDGTDGGIINYTGNFSFNTFSHSSNTNTNNIDNYVETGGSIIYDGDFKNNKLIQPSVGGAYTLMLNYASDANSEILFNGDFTNNEIQTVKNDDLSNAMINWVVSNGNISFNGNFSNNIFVGGAGEGSFDGVVTSLAHTNGTITYNQVKGNDITKTSSTGTTYDFYFFTDGTGEIDILGAATESNFSQDNKSATVGTSGNVTFGS